MGLKFNPLTGLFDFSGSAGGSGSTIGEPVAGATPHSILIVDGSSNLAEIGPLTDGQLIIGSTGLSAVASNLTGTIDQITVTNGPGSITLSLPQNVATSSSPTFSQLTLSTPTANRAVIVDGTNKITSSSVTDTELGYLSGVTSAIQTQISGLANTSLSNLSSTAINTNLIPDTDATRNLGSFSFSGGKEWNLIIGKFLYSGSGSNAISMEDGINLGLYATAVGAVVKIPSSNLDMVNHNIINVLDPVNPLDAANKEYVDAVAAGLDPKASVRVATTADLSATYATSPSNGQFTSAPAIIDDIVLVVNDRILVKNQTDPKENGIYTYTAANQLTRSSDMDGSPSNEVSGGNFTFVEVGTVNAGSGYVLQGNGTLTLNTDNLVWTQFSAAGSYSADGQGIELSGSQFQLELDGSTLSKSASGLKVADLGISDAQISNSAAISLSKLAALTINRALTSDGSGVITASSVTDTELGYVSGVTSAIQTQINNKVTATSGDIPLTSFSGANNQVAAADVTGFLFANANIRSFKALISVHVDATSPLYESIDLQAVQKGSSWDFTTASTGDVSNVVFTVAASGQVQYTSDNYAGFNALNIRFRAIVTNT